MTQSELLSYNYQLVKLIDLKLNFWNLTYKLTKLQTQSNADEYGVYSAYKHSSTCSRSFKTRKFVLV